MQLTPITKDALKTGDILLCKIPQLTFREYMQSLLQVLRIYISDKRFDLDAATPLIHWIIGFFDQYYYFHASFWNGTKLVESRIKGGLRENDISTYANDIVDIYRYHKDGQWLGSPALPVEPLLNKSRDLVDRHWAYGFDSAYLLAILCVTRWKRADWVDDIQKILVEHAHFPSLKESIAQLFEQFRPQIDAMIERLIVMALEVVRKYREKEGFVCSQTVAVIYNEATDETNPPGTFAIAKPTYAVAGPAHLLRATPPVGLVVEPMSKDDDVDACEDMIQNLRVELERLPSAQPRGMLTSSDTGRGMLSAYDTDYTRWQTGLRKDNFYTPRDLAESSNTRLVGRLYL